MRRLTTRATHGLWLAAVLTLAGCPLFQQFSTPSPQLRIIPAAFEFTDVLTNDSFNITNGGGGVLTWEIESVPDWLRVTSATSGAITTAQSARVFIETDTEGLDDGIFSGFVVVNSNGGRIQVPVVVGVGFVTVQPSIRVTPATLDFGRTTTQRTLEVRNGGIQGSFTFTATADQPWIEEITPATGSVSTTTSVTVTVIVSRADLADGEYLGNITISAPDLDDVVVPVRMEVDTEQPELTVSPLDLDFGAQTNTRTVTVRNTGRGLLSWEVIENLPWLEVTPLSGATTTQSNALTVRVNRAAQPPGLLEGTFLVRSGEGQEVTVRVTAQVLDATLVVTPTRLDFGASQTTKLISITNAGVGTVLWSIDTTDLPPWLSVSSASGSVSTGADTVLVTMDRTGLAPDLYSTTFQVNSNAGAATVSVFASALQPELTVTSGLQNNQGQPATTQSGVPIVDLGTGLTTATFIVANTGSGTLNWEISQDDIRPWFTLNPIQGTLPAGESQTVTVVVSRQGAVGSDTATVLVRSSAGNAPVIIARSIALRVLLGTDPEQFAFGTTDSTDIFLAANMGDPGTTVEYEIVSDREWLFVSPSTGTSQGTPNPPPFKDYRLHNIFIDRSRLSAGGGSGTLTLRATAVDTGQDPADVPTATVQVSVQAAPLSFEQTLNRGRKPSIVRFTFTMRDIFFETITTPIEAITADAFSILEEGVPLDLTETNVFLTNDYEANIMLALDYSGSMQVAASRVFNTANPLQDLYEAVIPDFLNELSPRYKVGLLAFFDRDQSARVQTPFTRDRAETIAALQALRTGIGQFGATELIPALGESAVELVNAAGFNVPFDDPDVRAVVSISDGRATTPPGDVTEFLSDIEELRVRFFNIAWGVDRDFGVPGITAVETGGHFYFTQNTFDGSGLEIPSQAALAERLSQLAFDLENQYQLTYITLNESSSANIRVTAAFDPPEDDGTPQNQGIIRGSFEQEAEMFELVGDTRLGQLSMRSDGIQPDTSAEVIIRADYIPREIDSFEFEITATAPFFVERIGAADGGIIEEWSLAQAGNLFTLESTDGPLPYGSFGPMLRLVFNAVPGGALEVNLAVNNALYASPPENPRFFTYPSILRVLTGMEAIGQAFPTPEFDVDPSTPDVIEMPLRLDIPSNVNTAQILIRNTGGVHLPTGVLLNWTIGTTPSFVAEATGPNGLAEGTLTATRESQLITLELDRSGDFGPASEPLIIAYDRGSLGYPGIAVITIATTIEPPELGVETPGPGNSIDFGALNDAATIVISNNGQSTLNWSIDTSGLPDWVAIPSTSGQLGPDGAIGVDVTVDRTGLAPALYSTSFVVSGFGQTVTVSVQMTVP